MKSELKEYVEKKIEEADKLRKGMLRDLQQGNVVLHHNLKFWVGYKTALLDIYEHFDLNRKEVKIERSF